VTADIANTSLDSVGEMDALLELPTEQAQKLIADAKTGKEVSARAKVKANADIKAKADAAERRLPPSLATAVTIAEALKAAKPTATKPTVQAASEKDEKAAAEEAAERWHRSLQSFTRENVALATIPPRPPSIAALDLTPAEVDALDVAVVFWTAYVDAKRGRKKETTH
jgi:hypothetical protein